MKLISATAPILAYCADRTGFLDLYSLINSSKTSRIVIVCYHRLSLGDPLWYHGAGISPETFEKEIAYLQKSFRIVSFDWLVEQILQEKPISSRIAVITFDDGYKDNYTLAYPILQKYKAPATIFLTTGYIGHSWPFHKARFALWNTCVKYFEVDGLGSYSLKSLKDRILAMNRIEHLLDELPKKYKSKAIHQLLEILDVDFPANFEINYTLSWDEISEMSRNGITFGAHTVTHTNLTRLSYADAKDEIIGSKREIEQKIGSPCTLFSYPNGNLNSEIVEILKDNDFKAAVSPIPLNPNKENIYKLFRIPSTNLYTFKAFSCGLYLDLMKTMKWIRY